MKNLILGLVCCVSATLMGQNTLYDGFYTPEAVKAQFEERHVVVKEIKKDVFVYTKGDYSIKYIIMNVDTLFFVDYYYITTGIFKDNFRVNVCTGGLSCIDCPNSQDEWVKESKRIKWSCFSAFDTMNDIIGYETVPATEKKQNLGRYGE